MTALAMDSGIGVRTTFLPRALSQYVQQQERYQSVSLST